MTCAAYDVWYDNGLGSGVSKRRPAKSLAKFRQEEQERDKQEVVRQRRKDAELRRLRKRVRELEGND